MNPDCLHLSWNTWQNQKELIRITDALETQFKDIRFCIRITLIKQPAGQGQAEISFYTEGAEEDRKICTVRHILGSYLSIQNVIAAVRAALHTPDRPSP